MVYVKFCELYDIRIGNSIFLRLAVFDSEQWQFYNVYYKVQYQIQKIVAETFTVTLT